MRPWSPKMQMYTVIYEQEGEVVRDFTTHALDEADAQAVAQEWFRDHPEHGGIGLELAGVTVRVELARRA
jgi:hypothetical protein